MSYNLGMLAASVWNMDLFMHSSLNQNQGSETSHTVDFSIMHMFNPGKVRTVYSVLYYFGTLIPAISSVVTNKVCFSSDKSWQIMVTLN